MVNCFPTLPHPNAMMLLAETHMAEVSQQYRETVASSGTTGWWYIFIPFAATAIACVIYYFGTRPPAIVNTPDGMLYELCKAHRINSSGEACWNSSRKKRNWNTQRCCWSANMRLTEPSRSRANTSNTIAANKRR